MRRVALVSAVVVLMFAAVVAAGFAATGHRGSHRRQPMVAARAHRSPGSLTKKLRSRSLKAAVLSQQRLVSATAVDARAQSRTEFAGQDEDAAFGTLDQAFPAALAAAPDPIASSDRAVKYVNDEHAAIVAPVDAEKASPEARKPRMVVSSLPLRVEDREGQMSPVSTDVTEPTPGELKPENALVDVVVNRDLHQGIEFPGTGVALRVTGADLDQPATVRKDRVFWANVQTDTDFMVNMLPDGVETFDVLRSQQSPERLSYEVDVPEGGSLALDEDRQIIAIEDKDGQSVAYAGAPIAADADGTPVTTHWVVQGTMLQIEVDHRQANVRYPILVDPEFSVDQRSWINGTSTDFRGWAFTESNPGALAHQAGNAGLGSGLNIWLPGNLTAPANLWGMWEFRAPGDTYVSRFEMAHFYWLPVGGRSCAVAGILGSDNPISWNTGQVTTPLGNSASPWGLCPSQRPGGVSDWYMTHTLTGSFTRGSAAAFQWWAPATLGSAWPDSIVLGGSYVVVVDDQAPGDFNISGLPAAWTNNPTLSFSAYATDHGLGMNDMEVDIDDDVVGEQNLDCDPDWRATVHCPATQRVDVIKTVSDGIHDLGVYGEDGSGNPGDPNDLPNGGWDNMGFEARVDTAAPGMILSGPAHDLAGQDLGEASYKLHVEADDAGAGPFSPVDVSGIGSIEFLVDNQRKDFKSQGCDQNCLDGDGAGLDGDFTFDTGALADGAHSLQVKVTDRAGNPTSTTWTVNVVAGTVTNPSAGLHVSRRATLEAHAVRSGITGVHWDYRTAANGSTPAGPWTTIPTSALRDSAGNQPPSTTIAVTANNSAPISWDTMSTLGLGAHSQALDVRGVFNSGTTNSSRVNFDTKGLDARTAHESIGPGQVNLLTGNFAVTSEDVNIAGGLADLRVNSTYNSRDASTVGPLGPGWKFSAPVLDDVDAVDRLVDHLNSGYVELVLGDGTSIPFTWNGNNLTPPIGYEQYSLSSRGDARPTAYFTNVEYLLGDATNGSTTLLQTDPAGGTTYFPQSVQEGPPATAVTSDYETVGGKQRIKALYGPASPGRNCSSGFFSDCRALLFVYATTTTATGSLPANWGDFVGQLSRIDLKTIDPTTGNPVIQGVSSYSYDSTGHLRASWDPRISPVLKEQYSYDANGLMISDTPAGDSPWTMSYTQINGETEFGRLSQVSRTMPAGSATWTMAYNLPLSGANAPMNMSSSAVGTWGQADLPTDVTAIFPPDQIPALPTSDYTRASVHYLNRDAYEVNDLEPGGELSTMERDRYGNTIRDLSPRNRATALAAGSPAARSHELDTQRTYQDNGLNLTDEIGPLHSVRLASGEVIAARRHTVTRYDETKPAGDTTDYHLPTTEAVSAQISGRADADTRTTTTDYDWTLRKPTKIVKGAQSGGPALTETMQYDSVSGLMTVHRQPRSPGSDAASTAKYTYYGTAACNSHPEWQWQLCQKQPGAQPGGSLPSLPATTYGYYRLGLQVSENRGGRVKATSYDNGGRPTQVSWSGTGTAVPTTTVTYDSSTGREATRSAVVNGSTRTIEHHYDSAGQLSQYVDGTGQSTTTTYDLLGRSLVIDDGKGTQTNTYDAVTGRLKQIVDSQAGTITATYDADGNVQTQTLPNGLKATYQIDEAGNAVDLAWVKTTGCSSACTWLHFTATRSIFDQLMGIYGTMSSWQYNYDGAGRLTFVRDTPVGQGCTTRKYIYDLDSNRTQALTYAPGSGGACDTTSTPTQVNHTYDAADRLADSGYVYDALGRTTDVPAGDAGEDGLSSSYFMDDRVRSQSQSDVTNTYDLDPARRSMVRSSSAAAGSSTETSHYSDDTDSPSWTATDTGHWSRNVAGVNGDLVATVDDTANAVLQLTDLHGNVAATAATSSTKVGETQVLQPVRSGSGWSLDPDRPLVPGAYVAQVRQNDASGNVGSATTHFKIGTAATPDQVYRDTVVGDGPEAYWRLGESSGTTAGDQTGTHSGTYVGGTTLGQSGALNSDTDTSARFDGVNDGVQAVDQPWRSTTGFAVESWVKTARRGGTLMSQGTAADSASWKVRVENTGTHIGQAQAVYNAGQRVLSGYSSVRIDDGQWHHLVASFAPNGYTRVTVDGVAQSTAAATVSTLPTYAFGFDEPSGSTAYNSGTQTLADGTIVGATRTTAGRFGGALTFSGASTYVQGSEPAGLGTALTIEAWVKPTTNNSPGYIAGKQGSGVNGALYQLGTSFGTSLNPFAAIGNQGSSITTPGLPLNAWSHVAMTWDKTTTTMKVYVNGQLVQTVTSVPNPVDTSTLLRIGANGARFFVGSIDEVKIFKRVLTQTEINVDQNVPANAASTNNPSVALGLDDNLGNVLTDRSGNGRDVTLSGTVGWSLGKFGSAITFNGTNNATITDPGTANSTTGITLSGWIKTSGVSSNVVLGGTNFGLVGARNSSVGPGVCGGGLCFSAPVSAQGVWTHLTATYDIATTTLRLYVNGVAAGFNTAAPSTVMLPGGIVGIGRDGQTGVPATTGSVDELRVYPRPLSAAEVAREWNMPVSQNPGGADPYVTLGNGGGANYFAGKLDEPATYPRVLTDTEITEHNRLGSPSGAIAAPSISAPADGASVADATPVITGTGPSLQMSPNLRVDVFSGGDITTNPVQSLLANRPTTTWTGESAKGLPAGTYTAKVTQNDLSGRYGTATRTFTIAGATDPETGYATSVRSDTPIAYWRLGETAGTTAADDRTGHPATYTGSPTLGSTGALSADTDKAPTLDGVNDRVDAPNTSGFFDPGTGSFSVEAWAKTTINGNEIIANKGTNWELAVTSDTGNVGKARFTYANGAVIAYSTARVDDGNWHHIVAVANRTTGATVYVDGTAGATTATANSTALTDTNPVRIGAGATTGGYFTGQVDEVAVYNTALAATRILVHARLGAQLDSTAPNPTITAPADGASTTNAALNFTGAAGNTSTDAGALSLSIAPDPAAGPLAVFDYDEFGTPRSPTSASRYGYLGGKQRSTELPSGIIAMGARSYIPTLGRFLQVDPVDGGSANPYDYVNQDPLNDFDLDGRSACARSGPACDKYHRWRRSHPNTGVLPGVKIAVGVGCALAIGVPTPIAAACGLAGVEQSLDQLPAGKQRGCPFPNKGRYRQVHHAMCS